jgi:hypothetical protein
VASDGSLAGTCPIVRLLGVVGALCAIAVLPAPADARKLFTGTTGQSRTARMEVAENGRPFRVTLSWKARCRRGTFQDVTRIQPPRRTTTPDLVEIAGAYRIRATKRLTARVTILVRGIRGVDPADPQAEVWSGSFRVSVVVRRRGRVFDRCRVPTTVWSAKPPLVGLPDTAPPSPSQPARTTQPSTSPPQPQPQPPPPAKAGAWKLEMNSDSGDYIGAGQRWVHGPPHDTIHVSGGPGGISFGVRIGAGGYWDGSFSPPRGQTFVSGQRYTGAQRDPFKDDGHPGMEITGHHRGCNTIEGEFTVDYLVYDQYGRIKSVKITFEQHCEGGSAALRGTLEYQQA